MQNVYYVKTVEKMEDIALAPVAEINVDRWNRGGLFYEAKGCAVYIPGTGLVARLFCVDATPRTEVVEEDGEVCEDSCLEFFFNANPTKVNKYVNCEANAIGTLHCKIGPDRYDRVSIAKEIRPTVKAERTQDGWQVTYTISEKCLETLFELPEGKLKPGHEMIGNFFKTGEQTPVHHTLSWNLIDLDKPDFHRPEWFGKLIVEG